MCPVERLNSESNQSVTKSVINVILVRLYFRYERRLASGQSINRMYETSSRVMLAKKKKRAAYLFTFCLFSFIHRLSKSKLTLILPVNL